MTDRRRSKLKRSRVIDKVCNPDPKREYIHQSNPLFRGAFKQWLKAYREKTGVKLEITGLYRNSLPLHFVGDSNRGWHKKLVGGSDRFLLRLVGYPDCLSVSVCPFAISVAVIIEGRFIDYLLDLGLSMPMRNGGQVYCPYYPRRSRGEADDPNDCLDYPSLEAYWLGRQFNPFGNWLTSKLSQAKWLSIYRNWSELTIDEPKGEELIQAVQLR